tara:strand:+ start:181 stop:360 length:180 start_codon:yes stop_codon:yes gene_type:complete
VIRDRIIFYIAKSLEFIGMSILAISLYASFPSRMSYESFIIAIAFFSIGFLIEKFVLKQ